MLGVQQVPFESDNQKLLTEAARALGVEDTFTRTPCGVFAAGALGTTYIEAANTSHHHAKRKAKAHRRIDRQGQNVDRTRSRIYRVR